MDLSSSIRDNWFWFVLLVPIVVAGRFTLAVYADYLVMQGRYDQALKLISILSFRSAGCNPLRVDVLIAAGRYDEAARVLRDVIHRRRGKLITKIARIKMCFDLENLGNVLMEKGRFEEAHRFFRDAAKLYPYHSVSSIGMAEALLRQGACPENALAHAEKALRLFQHGAERITSRSRLSAILATKAWALAACGHGLEAQEALDAALTGPVRRTKGPLAQVYYKAGMSYLALSQDSDAERHFACGAEVDPAGRWGPLCANALGRHPQSSVSQN